jgi:glycosyltransferase involved in cell wall biosynthesis
VEGVHIFGIPIDREHGNTMRYLYEYGIFLVYAAVFAARLHVKYRYDIVQIHNLPDTLIFATLLPKLMGARIVFDAHEAMPESFRIKFGWREKSSKDRLIVMLERICMGLADQVLTIHEPMCQLFIQQRGVRPDKISVVMNWPDERLFQFIEQEQSSVSDDQFTLVYAGTIAKRYGLQTVIQALPLLVQEIPNLCLRIIGKGDYTPVLKQLVKELNVETFVSFEPPVPLINIPVIYRSSKVGISPQLDPVFAKIYFSTKVAEYLAVGLPAIVARTPIMEYFFDNSVVAFFEPGDYSGFAKCVLKFYQDQNYLKSLIENGLTLSQKCNWSHEKRKYLSIIEDLALRN